MQLQDYQTIANEKERQQTIIKEAQSLGIKTENEDIDDIITMLNMKLWIKSRKSDYEC